MKKNVKSASSQKCKLVFHRGQKVIAFVGNSLVSSENPLSHRVILGEMSEDVTARDMREDPWLPVWSDEGMTYTVPPVMVAPRTQAGVQSLIATIALFYARAAVGLNMEAISNLGRLDSFQKKWRNRQ